MSFYPETYRKQLPAAAAEKQRTWLKVNEGAALVYSSGLRDSLRLSHRDCLYGEAEGEKVEKGRLDLHREKMNVWK